MHKHGFATWFDPDILVDRNVVVDGGSLAADPTRAAESAVSRLSCTVRRIDFVVLRSDVSLPGGFL